jgi:sterol desaturase/sphingolipid hydroxylase (fatty acid hydroxylase superfamily)
VWEHEATNILTESIPLTEEIQNLTAKRFIPYSLILSLTFIALVVGLMGIVVPLLNYVVILGIPYLIVSGMNSHGNYLKLYAEVRVVDVILKSKVHYDELHAQEIEEIMEILDQDE